MRWSPRMLGVATLVVVLPWSSMAVPGNLALFWDTAGTSGHGSFVNGDFCAGNDGACDCDATLPVEPTTWGQIKALYTGVVR